MATKRFCDGCGKELVEKNNGFNLTRDCISMRPGFLVLAGNASNGGGFAGGDWCKYCVIEAVNMLDDRPRQAPERNV